MPHFDAFLFKKKGIKKKLSLEFEQGENILGGIRLSMQQNGLNEVTVIGMDGMISEGMINYFEGNRFMHAKLKDTPILMASGSFKLSFGDLFGSMKVVSSDKPPMHGTLTKGTAADGLRLNLTFIELVDK